MQHILVADKADILVVDDQPENLQLLIGALSADHVVHPFTNGPALIRYLEAGRPADLILLDVVMPPPDGFTLIRMIKERRDMIDVPVIFLTALHAQEDEELGLSIGAADYITKPFSIPIVRARVQHHLRLGRALRVIQDMNEYLEDRVRERTADLARAQQATVLSLSTLLETRDSDTGHHIHRTQQYVKELAISARKSPRFSDKLNSRTIDLLYQAAALHDIGKVAIPDQILLKPGKLTPEEYEVMKTHAWHGGRAIANSQDLLGAPDQFLEMAREIAQHHHERWDGRGYPDNLLGEDIPLAARLMAIADVYDALISPRAYKPAFSHDEAVEMIVMGKGTQFDPHVVEAFEAIHFRFDEIATTFRDSGMMPLI